jgi:hypothetical protein
MVLRACRRLPALALVLALALPGAPVMRTLAAHCERCPRSCPMHDKSQPKRLRCHDGGRAAEAPMRGCHRTAGIAMPGCGYTGDAPLGSLAPTILPTRAPAWARVAMPALHAPIDAARTRAADPPDTPPPIGPA